MFAPVSVTVPEPALERLLLPEIAPLNKLVDPVVVTEIAAKLDMVPDTLSVALVTVRLAVALMPLVAAWY